MKLKGTALQAGGHRFKSGYLHQYFQRLSNDSPTVEVSTVPVLCHIGEL